jgi:hypothetical protein
MKFSPQEAFEYRLKTNGTPIPEFYGDVPLDTSLNDTIGTEETVSEDIAGTDPMQNPENTDNIPENPPENPPENLPENTPDDVQTVEGNTVQVSGDITQEGGENTQKSYTRDDFKKLLTEAGVKYFGGSTDEQLAELCIKNELI